MARKKPEGIEALIDKPEPVSIQEITMLDWYAAFALLGASNMASPDDSAKEAFSRAVAMMKERGNHV